MSTIDDILIGRGPACDSTYTKFMSILVETTPQPNARLRVAVYEVTGETRRPVEYVFIGLRHEVQRHRANMIDKYSDGRADEVHANALPVCRQ